MAAWVVVAWVVVLALTASRVDAVRRSSRKPNRLLQPIRRMAARRFPGYAAHPALLRELAGARGNGEISMIELIMGGGQAVVEADALPTAFDAKELMAAKDNYVEHVVAPDEDLDSVAHSFYFGDHFKALELLAVNKKLARLNGTVDDRDRFGYIKPGTKIVIPKPVRKCEKGWKAFGGPPKLEQVRACAPACLRACAILRVLCCRSRSAALFLFCLFCLFCFVCFWSSHWRPLLTTDRPC